MYSREQFDLLKPVDLAGAQVGGKPVTEREFAALALFAGSDPEIGVEALKVAGDPEPVIDAFMADGYSLEESREIITESGREMYGRSLMDRRQDTGNYFAGAVQPAREKAKQVLEAYQRDDKGPMADILARMVGNIGREATSRLGLPESFFAQNQLAGEMLDMMERDPELKRMTEQKYEQHEQEFHSRHPQFLKPPSFAEQMGSIRQAQELNRMRMKSVEAKAALLDAQLKGDELPDDRKQGYARDILKYSIVSHMYTADTAVACSTAAPNPRNGTYRALFAHTNKFPDDEKSVGSKSGGSSAPVSPRPLCATG